MLNEDFIFVAYLRRDTNLHTFLQRLFKTSLTTSNIDKHELKVFKSRSGVDSSEILQ